VTGGAEADWLCISAAVSAAAAASTTVSAASTATATPQQQQKPRLVAVWLPRAAPGLSLLPAPAAPPFVPEVPHATLTLRAALAPAAAAMRGDAAAAALVPFRALEDACVTAALAAAVLGARARFPALVATAPNALPSSAAAASTVAEQPVAEPVAAALLALGGAFAELCAAPAAMLRNGPFLLRFDAALAATAAALTAAVAQAAAAVAVN